MKKKVLSCLLAAAMVLSFSLPVLAAEEEAAVAEEVAVEAPAEDVVLETAAEDETDSSSEDANADSTEETTEDAQAADESTTEDAATEEDAASEEEAAAEEETAVEAEEETPSTSTQSSNSVMIETNHIDASEVEIKLDAPDEIVYGQDYEGKVTVSNKSSKDIRNAYLQVYASFLKDKIYRILYQTIEESFTLGAGETKEYAFTLNNWDLEFDDEYDWKDLIGTEGTLRAFLASRDIDNNMELDNGRTMILNSVAAEQPVTLVSKADGAVDESKSPKTGESSVLLWLSAAMLLGGALVIRKGRHAA